MNPTRQDIQLWEGFLQGDREALGTLFRLYYPDLYRYGLKIAGDPVILEDNIQELFIELWQHRTPVPAVSIKAYLLQALKYKLLKALHRSVQHQPASEWLDNIAFDLGPETFIIAKEEGEAMAEKIQQAMQQLSDRQKEIIYLKFYQNLGYEEVSELMHINYQAARNLLYQAVKALRKLIS